VLSYEWAIPFRRQAHTWYQHGLGNWQFNGILTLMRGTRFTVFDPNDISLHGSAPEISPATVRIWPEIRTPVRAPRSSGSTPADYTRSQLPDSTVRQRRPQRGARPGFSTWDFAALKNISVAEGKELQFRAELFNFLNHTNLRLPNSDISSPTFGEIHSSDPGSAKIELLGERLRWKV